MGFFKKVNNSYSEVSFEVALALTGFGRYQIFLVGICCLIYLSCGIQNGLNAYVMLAAKCDLSLTSSEKGLLNVVFLAGGISSSFLWGLLADHLGRKKVLIASLIMDSAITLLSSFSQTFQVFAIFRFFSGFIIGCPASLICTYLGEFLCDRYRAVCLCITGLFWTISWLLLPAIAMIIFPLDWEINIRGFLYNSWRLYIALFAAPTAFSALFLGLFFHESPTFLDSIGDKENSLLVMKQIFKVNCANPEKTYAVEYIRQSGTDIAIVEQPQTNQKLAPVFKILREMLWGSLLLVKSENLRATLLACALQFSNMFGYYGFGMWLPEVSERFEEHYSSSNVSLRVCELQSNLNSTNIECLVNIESSSFWNFFIIGASGLVGNILCSLVVRLTGLKLLTIVTMGLSGVCTIIFYFVNSTFQNLVLSCAFMACISVANSVITSVICDLFPTKVRGLAACSSLFIGRIGSLISNLILGYLLDFSCEIPIFLISLVLIGGGLVGLFLPGKPLITKL